MGKFGYLLLAIVCIIGCSAPEREQATLSPIPEQLVFIPSEKGQKLSNEQMDEIRSKIGARPQMIMPDLEMVFSTKRFNTQEVRQKELDLQSRDPNSYSFLKDLQSGCLKERPTTVMNATFPTDSDFSVGNLRTGDTFKLKSSAALYGDNCPVKFAGIYSVQLDVNGAEQEKKNINISGSASQEGRLLMLSPKYANILKAKGLLINSNISGLHIREDIKAGTLVNFNANGTYMSLEADTPFEFKVTMLIKKNGDQKETQEMIAKGNLTWLRLPISVDIHQQKSIVKYYVNGHELSASEFERMFGTKSPVYYSTHEISSAFPKN